MQPAKTRRKPLHSNVLRSRMPWPITKAAIWTQDADFRGMFRWTQERSHPMGDKKGKKDKAKGQRQKQAKEVRTAKQKQDKRQAETL